MRWIGAAKRRLAKPIAAAEIEVPSAQIIHLSWADTFGRPMRVVTARKLQFAGASNRCGHSAGRQNGSGLAALSY